MIRLGVDIGGTFTDIVLLDEEIGRVTVAKVPSAPTDPASALVAAIRRALERTVVTAEPVTVLSHGTTVVHPGRVVVVDGWGNLLIPVGPGA